MPSIQIPLSRDKNEMLAVHDLTIRVLVSAYSAYEWLASDTNLVLGLQHQAVIQVCRSWIAEVLEAGWIGRQQGQY